MTAPIGYATLQFIPSLQGVSDGIEKQLKGMPGLGRNAGKLLGGGIVTGLKASESDVKRAMDGYAKLYDKAADATGKLRAEEAKLKDLQDRGVSGGRLVAQSERAEKARRDEARAVREARDSYKEYERAAESAAGSGDNVGGGLLDKIKGLAGQAKSGGTEAASGFVEGFGGPIAALGTKAGPIGLALAAAAALGVGAGTILAQQVMAGVEQEQQQANVAAKLGLSAEQMKPIADASAAAYAANFGESVAGNMDAARVAIQSGLLDPSATQADVQAMVQQLSTVSDVMGEEIPATARAAQQAIRTGLVDNATSAFDLFVRAQQSGLNVSEDFLDTINEYGTQFRKLGLDGPEAVGLISQAVKGGARDADVAADALKEFSIRAIDGSKATSTAFTTLGYSTDEVNGLIDKLSNGGEGAHEAFGKILNDVKGIQDPFTKSAVSVGLFGTQAEDLGGALNAMDLSTAVDQLGAVDGAAADAANTMGNTTASSVESAKRAFEQGSASMQQSLAAAFGPSLQTAATWVTDHQDEIAGGFKFIAGGATEMGAAVIGVTGSIVTGFGYVVSSTGDLVGFMLDGFEQIVGGAATIADAVGLDGLAGDLRGAQGQLGVWSDQFHGWGEGMVDLGKDITGAGIALHDLDLNAAGAGNSAAGASAKVQALGNAINTIPNQKDTIVTLNDAAAKERAQQLATIIGGLPGAKNINIEAVVVYKDTNGIVIPPDQLRAPTRAPAVPGDTYRGPGRAGGGMIPGFSTTDDRLGIIPGKGLIGLAGGEGIVKATATRKLGGKPFIDFLNGFADGGVVPGGITIDSLKNFASGIAGQSYVWGGGNGDTFATDCSGAQSTVANYLTGGSGRFATASEAAALASRGFRTGDPPAGITAYWIGWRNGGPGGGHTAGTIVDPIGGNVNVEMGGASGGGAFGGKAAGAAGFPNRAWFPVGSGDDPSKDNFGGASPFAGGSAVAAVTGGSSAASASTGGTSSSSSSSSGGMGGNLDLPSSLDGFGKWGAGKAFSELGKLGEAAGTFVDGQVSSALDVFGIPSDPGWLKGISTFVNGLSIGGGGAAGGFDGASLPSLGGGWSEGGDPGNMHGARAGQAPGPTYNITARDTEDAFVKAQRIEREKSLTKLSRF